ncbi:MAG: DUF2062 domain-containing protein [Steroidobacteraceae bacterium]
MPRRFLRKLAPHPDSVRNRWYFRVFGRYLADSRLWSMNRRAVTAAFAAGLAICFLPLPIHIPLAILIAISWHLNVPVILGTVLLVNPLTVVPIYYAAYRTGAAVLGHETHRFKFQLNWEWLQYGLGPIWKPFLVGCALCALVLGVGSYFLLNFLWRWSTLRRNKLRHRRGNTIP